MPEGKRAGKRLDEDPFKRPTATLNTVEAVSQQDGTSHHPTVSLAAKSKSEGKEEPGDDEPTDVLKSVSKQLRVEQARPRKVADNELPVTPPPSLDAMPPQTPALPPLPAPNVPGVGPTLAPEDRFEVGLLGDLNQIDELDEQAYQEAVDPRRLSKHNLMHLSGMMRAVRFPKAGQKEHVEEWWPEGIKQTGAFPVVNIYGKEPFGRTSPAKPVIRPVAVQSRPQRGWKNILNSPLLKIVIGFIIGIALLFLVSKVVDIPTTIAIIKSNLSTPRGIAFALLSGVAFLAAFSIRGVRWKLFLNPIGEISVLKAIQLFLVGIFLNFLLPVRGGEVAKSLMLKRIANIPISQSLPTVAMDKALDLMPALFIMALVPMLGVQMDIKLWLVLGAVSGLLICLIFFVALAAWKRNMAISLLQKITNMLPASLGSKIEGFATGFVDSLLAGASQPRIFIPAVILTLIAVVFDGLFAMLAFWTVGVPIAFGTALFGYTVYNMFYILPTPPGQVGSNEAVGLLVFYGLLHLNARGVTAMFFFSHPWAALLMCVAGLGSLSALGLTVSSAMKVQSEGEKAVLPVER
ncbi:flippase-like domain-containing protein [Ktedonosporobacter rubrisoli]|uniref:Flippase-like domain-containing protein n=1 Tax=Ktedonosporobacter rubrisoli TaxID=2509675 RepID=A0A4P6JWJ9_KTERU|nr:lysylphosphatidylglycerol synthase transmembrane domain-containing protein [Ktedonosporobacter rubrisoli]QBD79762.1 flippase-like domain-containing protein [Ktedonosporobacter rubrisoli]